MATYNGEIQLTSISSQASSWAAKYLQSVRKEAEHAFEGDPEEKEAVLKFVRIAEAKLPKNLSVPFEIKYFEIDGLVGFGSFGNIWKVNHPSTGAAALKQLPANLDNASEVWKERDMLILLKHKRICDIMGAFFEQDVFFVLELCHGSVALLNPRISWKNAVRFAVQLLDGLDWIHRKDIVHADIKPDNCLINTANNLVLSDFGSAMILKRRSVTTDHAVGSLGYMDYNATKYHVYTTHTDLFGAACVMYEMDCKSFFLKYADGQDHSTEVYIDALENGRFQGVTPRQTLEYATEREMLVERCKRSRFGSLLAQLIDDPAHRMAAGVATKSPLLFELMSDAGVSPWTIDNEADIVSKDFNNHQTEFSMFEGEASLGKQLALESIYYVDYDKVKKQGEPLEM